MSDRLNLEFLLEKTTPAGEVELHGEVFQIFQADIIENFATLIAMTERVANNLKLPESDEKDPKILGEKLEQLRTELRSMIQVICPGMTEEFLRKNFPKMGQLQGLFESLVMHANKSLPESVKKNSETMPKAPEPTPESAKIS